MDRGAWRATVHRVTKSWTWLERLSMQHACMHTVINKRFSISLPEVTQTGQDLSKLDRGILFSLPELQLWLWKGWFILIKWTIGKPASKHPLKQESKYFTYYYVMQLVEKHQNNNTVTIKGQYRQNIPFRTSRMNGIHLRSSQFLSTDAPGYHTRCNSVGAVEMTTRAKSFSVQDLSVLHKLCHVQK